MKLTQAEVHNVAFSRPPLGRRGYNEDEVDKFLDMVESTIAELNDEIQELQEKLAAATKGEYVKPAPVEESSEPVDETPAVDVDAVRREVEAEYENKLAEARREADEAHTQLEQLRQERQSAPAEQPAAVAPHSEDTVATPDTHMKAARIIGLAQEMADRVTADASADAKRMLDEARDAAEKAVTEARAEAEERLSSAHSEADRLLNEAHASSEQSVTEAQQKAEELVGGAQAEADRLVTEARTNAENLVREAEEKAHALEAEAQQKHNEIMATMMSQRTALEERCSKLRVFEREYRTRMKSLLENQLEELMSQDTAEPNGDGAEHN